MGKEGKWKGNMKLLQGRGKGKGVNIWRGCRWARNGRGGGGRGGESCSSGYRCTLNGWVSIFVSRSVYVCWGRAVLLLLCLFLCNWVNLRFLYKYIGIWWGFILWVSYVKRNSYVSLCMSVKFNLFDLLRVLYSEV